MSEITTPPKRTERCDACRHWTRYYGENKGRCNAMPPTATASGFSHRPTTGESDYCLMCFKPMEAGEQTPTHTKHQPETPGQAAQAARKERRK